MSIYAYLFDARGQDRQVKLEPSLVAAVAADAEQQLLWIDLNCPSDSEFKKATELLDVPTLLLSEMVERDGSTQELRRPRLDLYNHCFHLNVQAVQERGQADGDGSGSGGGGAPFRLVGVHFVVFANIVLTLHDDPVAFLDNFDERIKGDTHLGSLDGPAFLGALLNWHVTGYFRAMEVLESEVDRIDDAALRLRRTHHEERDLLAEMVKVRRRLALVRRALLPHREVYAGLARPHFAPFVTPQATETLGLVYERMERAAQATENARELVLGSFDIFSTQTALRTNEVVKALTLISALLLPAGVVANLSVLFIRAPVYDLGRAGFWSVAIGTVTLGFAFLIVARKRNWF